LQPCLSTLPRLPLALRVCPEGGWRGLRVYNEFASLAKLQPEQKLKEQSLKAVEIKLMVAGNLFKKYFRRGFGSLKNFAERSCEAWRNSLRHAQIPTSKSIIAALALSVFSEVWLVACLFWQPFRPTALGNLILHS
jgi:hypothetical protein